MPFTGSHPAAVLPFVRWGLIPSALVIGSMSPDLPYFLPLHVGGGETHSPVGLVTVDLAIGAGAFAIWQLLLARPLWWAAPARLRERIPEPRLRPGSSLVGWLLLIALCLTLGAATHLLWDGFTHAGRFGTTRIGWLSARHGPMPGFRWAQYASSVVGALIEAAWLYAWWQRAEIRPATASPGRYRRAVLAAWAAVVVATLATAAHAAELSAAAGDNLRRTGFLVITRGGLGAMLAVALLAAGWHVTRLSARPR